jgi:hypothetical protein
MPSPTPKTRMLQNLVDSLRSQGAKVEVTKDTHPYQISVTYNNTILPFSLYIWNLTPHTPNSDDYRIQITGIRSINSTASRPALLLGWEPRKKVFVGYRSESYKSFGSSPSIHASLLKMSEAKRKGIAIQEKRSRADSQSKEIVVAVRPDRLLNYILNRATYHSYAYATVNQISTTGVQITDKTDQNSKQRMLERALKLFRGGNRTPVVTRPQIDLSGLSHPTSNYSGSIRGKDHVKVEFSTKVGRATSMDPVKASNLTGGVVYVERGYENFVPDQNAMTNFDARIKSILQAMRQGSEGPNPENMRTIVTHASTDARLFREHDFIGFNVVDAADPDPFWILAAGREVAYLKYLERYQHLRAMTELAVRAFRNLGLGTPTTPPLLSTS